MFRPAFFRRIGGMTGLAALLLASAAPASAQIIIGGNGSQGDQSVQVDLDALEELGSSTQPARPAPAKPQAKPQEAPTQAPAAPPRPAAKPTPPPKAEAAKPAAKPAPAPKPSKVTMPAAKPAPSKPVAAAAPKPPAPAPTAKAPAAPPAVKAPPAVAPAVAAPPAPPRQPEPTPAPTPPPAPAPAPAPAATARPAPPPAVEPAKPAVARPPKLPAGDSFRLLFGDKQADIPADAKAQLAGVSQRLSADEGLRLQVRAYASGSGDSGGEARRLSLSRALAVRSYLIDQGLRSTRIDVRALGSNTEETPADRVDLQILR